MKNFGWGIPNCSYWRDIFRRKPLLPPIKFPNTWCLLVSMIYLFPIKSQYLNTCMFPVLLRPSWLEVKFLNFLKSYSAKLDRNFTQWFKWPYTLWINSLTSIAIAFQHQMSAFLSKMRENYSYSAILERKLFIFTISCPHINQMENLYA